MMLRSFARYVDSLDHTGSQQRCQALADRAAGPIRLATPGVGRRAYQKGAVRTQPHGRRAGQRGADHRRPREANLGLGKRLPAQHVAERTRGAVPGRDHVAECIIRAVLVLASRSPRRARLLREAGYEIEVVPADIDESRLAGEEPRRYVLRVAAAKAAEVASTVGDRVVVAADTVVLIDGLVLGKPVDRREAASMIDRLSGRTHEVLTGVVAVRGARVLDAVEVTRVTFAALDAARIAWYAGTGEPDDKAGAYAAQGIGSRFVERIEGSYTNVVGLPMALVDRFVRELQATR
jgi:septum formation protein